ncbi:MAG: J domain-containing protein [Acidimicrobiales bacterium]
MARSWFRKRRGGDDDTGPSRPGPDRAHLDDDEHAWWAQREVAEVWTPRPRRGHDTEAKPDDERDILAEHFGDDWRTSFGFTEPTAEELDAAAAAEQQALDDQDPYKVLQVDPTASWEEIVAAHRHQARVHHPDRLFGQSPEEVAAGEERIRVINAAYQELQVRRGK